MSTQRFTDGRAPCLRCAGRGRIVGEPCFTCHTLGWVVAEVRANPRTLGLRALRRLYAVPEYRLDGECVDLRAFVDDNAETFDRDDVRAILSLRPGESMCFGGGAFARAELQRVG